MKNNLKKFLKFLIISACVYAFLLLLIKTEFINRYYERVLMTIGINIILALSLNLITGFTGQLALGHAGFMSIGAYTAAVLTMQFNMPLIISMIGGGIMAGLFGYLIGLPTLRLKGDYLAITTLGFGEIIRVIINNINKLGGSQGLTGIPMKSTFTWVYVVMIITIIIIFNIIHSSLGRAMISVREDEVAAEAMGINTTKYKIIAFVIGSFFAGIAGGLYAHFTGYLDPVSFNFIQSTFIVMYVVLGGLGSIWGCVVATGVLTYLPEMLRNVSTTVSDLRMVIYPILLIVMMRFCPRGVVGLKDMIGEFIFSKNRGGKSVAAGNK